MTEHSAIPIWKKLAHDAYFYSTATYRWFWMQWSIQEGRAPMMILFYHRIADEKPNPWTMSNDCFIRQMNWISARFDMVSLEEMQRRMRGHSTRPAVSITFDDGYAENCESAIPWLIKNRIPCTYFTTLRNVETGEPFPHDAALRQPFRPNTIEQLKAMAAAGIEIGCHTRTHLDLGVTTNREQIEDEVVAARDALSRHVQRPVRYFAFPFGMHANLNSDVFQLARDAGYDAACSAYGGYNFPDDDPFHLKRIHGDPQFVRLRNDLTVDPRKVHSTERFQAIGVDSDNISRPANSDNFNSGQFNSDNVEPSDGPAHPSSTLEKAGR
jgi:peptidoglycan/xylan/chitin deacetylase (PgdA/CDA1 family)